MIELNEKWAIEVGPREHDFALIERKQGKTREGDEKITEVKTFHPNFEQIANKLTKRECITAMEAATSLQDLIDTVNQAAERIAESIANRG